MAAVSERQESKLFAPLDATVSLRTCPPSSEFGPRLERRRNRWAMARDFERGSSGGGADFDSDSRSLAGGSCGPFEPRILS